MCLSVIYKGEQKKKALAKLPDVVTGWAITITIDKKCYPFYSFLNGGSTPLHAGINKAIHAPERKTRIEGYSVGFHRLLKRQDIFRSGMAFCPRPVMTCKIHKKDITAIGEYEHCLCIVAKEITCPKCCGKEVKK